MTALSAARMQAQDAPWHRKQQRDDAFRIACDVRELDAVELERLITRWPVQRIVQALITAAAMVDIDQHPSLLTAWEPDGSKGRCAGGHPWTADTTSFTTDGRRRCKPCYAAYRRRERAAQKATRLREAAQIA